MLIWCLFCLLTTAWAYKPFQVGIPDYFMEFFPKGIVPESMADFILPYGYPLEEHFVTTDDGYILTLYRIPHGVNNTNDVAKSPLLLQHGLLVDSASWVINDPSHGLGFIMADAGYDVWFGNSRGCAYSRKHTRLDPKTDAKEYWNFSFHEMGYYDLPAVIDFILNTTKHSELSYIGHSQGTTQLFVLLSTKPSYNKKIRVATALAPVAFMENTKGTVRRLADFSNPISWLLDHLHIYEVLQNNFFLHLFDQRLCRKNAITQPLCDNILFLIAGYDSQQLDKSLVPKIVDQFPAGASTKQLKHYSQSITNGNQFRQYDYGSPEGNYDHYNTSEPPSYNLTNIVTPILLYFSENDWLARPKDVKTLFKSLNVATSKAIEVNFPPFNHLDFLWAKDVKKLLYNDVLKQMKKFE